MRALLFEIQPADPVTFISVSAALTIVGLLSAMGPGHRAAGVSPLEALRNN